MYACIGVITMHILALWCIIVISANFQGKNFFFILFNLKKNGSVINCENIQQFGSF